MKMKSLLLAIACGTALQTAYAADIKSVDAIAAIAGDNVITQRQLNIAVAQANKRLPASARPNPTELRQQVLVQLINQALIVEAGKRRGITATDTEIDGRWHKVQPLAKSAWINYMNTMPKMASVATACAAKLRTTSLCKKYNNKQYYKTHE